LIYLDLREKKLREKRWESITSPIDDELELEAMVVDDDDGSELLSAVTELPVSSALRPRSVGVSMGCTAFDEPCSSSRRPPPLYIAQVTGARQP
jgi:hypothetical protein